MCLNTIDLKANKARCLELLRSTGREGMEDMIIELEKMGYFTAPASSYYHLNVEGGLVQHSLNVYDAAMVVWEGMKQFRPKLGSEVTRKEPESDDRSIWIFGICAVAVILLIISLI